MYRIRYQPYLHNPFLFCAPQLCSCLEVHLLDPTAEMQIWEKKLLKVLLITLSHHVIGTRDHIKVISVLLAYLYQLPALSATQ